jgi:isoleucyl-tRNA synthetase
MDITDLKKKIKKGELVAKINGKEYEITKDHFQIEQIAKKPYAVALLSYGTILINSELDKELKQEGFAREFIRNVQNIRKKLNLSRFKEKIIINVSNDINLKDELGEFTEEVKEEVGCTKIGKGKQGKPYSFKIQGKQIKILVDVQE